MSVPYTKKQIAYAVKHIVNKTYQEVANELEVSPKGLRKRLTALGVRKRATRDTVYNKQVGYEREVYAEYLKGYSVAEIATRLGITAGLVARNLADKNIVIPTAIEWFKSWDFAREKLAWQTYKKLGYAKTAAKLNCTVYELAYIFWCGKCNAKFPEEFNLRTRAKQATGILKHRVQVDHAKGLSYKELSSKFQITFIMVRRILQDSGQYKTRDTFQGLTTEQKAELKRLYERGTSVERLGIKFGKKPPTLYAALHELGVKLRHKHKSSPKHMQPTQRDITDWENYQHEVRMLSQDSYAQNIKTIDPKRKRSADWHLDHKFSVLNGFRRQVPPHIVAHPCNLRVITSTRNIVKRAKNSISLKELKDLIRTNSL